MDRIWLKSYPPGVPAEIDTNEFASLGDLFERSCASFAERIAYLNMGCGMSYAELEHWSARFAGYLQGELKLPKGARVALMMPNVLQYPVCLFGALRAGYVVVNCNPLYTPRELGHQLRDSGSAAIVIVENFAHVLQDVLEGDDPPLELRHVVVTGLGDMLGWAKGTLVNFVVRYVKNLVPRFSLPNAVPFSRAMALGDKHPLVPVAVNHDDLAFLQYTGGTTGIAKGAMLSHGNIIANLQQAHAWLRPFLNDEHTETIVTALPLYHIFSLTANCLTFLKLGACNLLITNPRDIPGFVKELTRYPVTIITGVNTLFNALLHNPDFVKLDFSGWRIALGGGMALQKVVADRWQQLTGMPLLEAYGLTETSPAATINPVNLPSYNGSIGLPIPSTDVAIRNDDDQDLAVGQAGEICIRGPQVMVGYYHRPEETARFMTRDGFLRTGDIGIMDERGYITIVDRKKDMILVSGFNVYPNEVESVVIGHPGVLEVAAVGIPDEHSGEALKLFVVRKDPNLSEAELLAYCKQNLTGYKRPRAIEFRDELPKSNVGKILRRELRESAARG